MALFVKFSACQRYFFCMIVAVNSTKNIQGSAAGSTSAPDKEPNYENFAERII
jgi:hypothetical protein